MIPWSVLGILQDSKPFFSNDLEGLIKVLGFLVALTGLMLGIMDRVASKRRALEARLDTLERDNVVMKADIRGLDETYGSTTEKLEALVSKLDSRHKEDQEMIARARERLAGVESKLDYLIRNVTKNG